MPRKLGKKEGRKRKKDQKKEGRQGLRDQHDSSYIRLTAIMGKHPNGKLMDTHSLRFMSMHFL